MHKKWYLFVIIALISIFTFTSAQNAQTSLASQGSNFETMCLSNSCETIIYSYDKYFNRNSRWEEIDENWHICGEMFCTNNYYFQAIADSNGRVAIQNNNKQFTQQISRFRNENLSIFSLPVIEGSLITYPNILPNIDLRYQYLPHKLKEELIIKERLENILEDFEIVFNLDGNLRPSIELPFVCDSGRKCRPINYTIDSNQVSLIIPSRFLNSENTVYPVIIDPSFSLGKSSIIWNGVAGDWSDGDIIDQFRINNPSSLQIGYISGGKTRGDIDWNLDLIPNIVTINNATLKLFFETLTSSNYINITNMGRNSSQWPDDIVGNIHFYNDMGNGSVYSNYTSTSSSTNVSLNFTFNQQGIDSLNTVFTTSQRFSTGITSNPNLNVTISARDHPIPIQRPILIIQTTQEDYNLTYDANGNTISGFGKYLEYDSWNRLSRIRQTNSTGTILAEYFYDHEGKRILKMEYNVEGNGHNESTYYMNTRPADFIQVINTNGTIINETYIYLQD